VAIKCSVAVYDPIPHPSLAAFAFEKLHHVPASLDGVTKATTFTKVTKTSGADATFPALVVAVRGSKAPIDWVVNANYEARDALDLFVRSPRPNLRRSLPN
jgi:hypothetical protein